MKRKKKWLQVKNLSCKSQCDWKRRTNGSPCHVLHAACRSPRPPPESSPHPYPPREARVGAEPPPLHTPPSPGRAAKRAPRRSASMILPRPDSALPDSEREASRAPVAPHSPSVTGSPLTPRARLSSSTSHSSRGNPQPGERRVPRGPRPMPPAPSRRPPLPGGPCARR